MPAEVKAMSHHMLWKAWPQGYLAMRGVHTVGGFTCVAVEDGQSWWCSEQGVCRRLDDMDPEILKAGRLLPKVYLADTATWACLTRDLATALEVPSRPDEPNHSFTWYRGGEDNEWGLTVVSQFGWTTRSFPGLNTEDPELALVVALIQIRAEEATP